MKIYGRYNESNVDLRTFNRFAGKDVWILAKVDFFEYYINIIEMDGNIVHYYWLKPQLVEHPRDEYWRTSLRQQLRLIMNDGPDHFYLAPTDKSVYKRIRLYPDKGVYTTDELLEMAGLIE